MVAMPLFILDLTGSGTKMGLFAMIGMIPALAIAPFAGVLGDRFNRKNIMIITDYIRGVLILFLAYRTFTGDINLAFLFGMQVFISLFDSFFGAATSAMVPDLVPEKDLMKANSLTESFSSASMIVGPVLGGVFQAATPVGMALMGFLVDRIEVHILFIIIAILILLDVMIFSKKLDSINLTPSLESE